MKCYNDGKKTIVIATPYSRNDGLENNIRGKLKGYEVLRIRSKEELNVKYLKKIYPKYIFFPHWSWIIPEEIYSNYECVIFHMTDLPYGRGGSPLQNLIVRGHKETKLSALKCSEGLDTGPVYMKCSLSLEGTAEDILKRASDLMEKMIINIVKNNPVAVPQSGVPVVFKRRNKEDGNLINLSELDIIYDHIRMLDADGYPKAFLETENIIFEFCNAELNKNYIDAKVIIRVKNG